MDNIDFIGQTPTPVDNCAGQIIPTDLPTDVTSPTLLHNSLDGLQGGTVNEYYHLTKAEHDNLFSGTSSFMDLHSAQTADGIKTFTHSPQVPNGISGTDAVNYNQLIALIAATPTNGLQTIGSMIGLGGALTQATTIDVHTYNFLLQAYGLTSDAYLEVNQFRSLLRADSITTNDSGLVQADNTGSTVQWTQGSTTYLVNVLTSISGITLTDQVASKGAVYAADYSTNFTARSLIDKGYADSHYTSSSSGITSVSITSANGITGTSSGGTTPALTLALGNITPTSVAIQGTAGAGYITLPAQSSTPTSPSAGTLLLYSATTNGFTRLEQDNEGATNIVYARDAVFVAKNTSGGTLSKGNPVYISGSTGNVPNIAYAKADNIITSRSVAIVVDDIANGAFGQVMVTGIISRIDTSAYTSGDVLYLSTTVAGALTNVKPSGTSNTYVSALGQVLVSGVGNGSLKVNVTPFIGNNEIGTTAATFAANAIIATTFTGSGSGITGLSLTTGVTGILPYANGGTNVGTAWTAGSILYAGASALAQDNANFFWDGTNHRLGLATTAPTHTLTLGSTTTGFAYYNTSDQTTNYERLLISTVSNQFVFNSQSGGTGTHRSIAIQLDGAYSTIFNSTSIVGALNAPRNLTSGSLASFGINGAMTNSSGTVYAQTILPIITQTSTAASTMIWISPFYQTVGSGAQLLIDAGTNTAGSGSGTHTSKFKVDNTGAVTAIGAIVGTGGLNTGASVTSNFYTSGGTDIGVSTTSTTLLFGGAPNVYTRTLFNGSSSSTIAAGSSYSNVIIGSSLVTLNTTGTSDWLTNAAINGLGTVTNASSIPVTNTASLYVGAASSAGTNNYTAYFDTGTVRVVTALRAGSLRGDAVAFASLPGTPVEGMLVSVTDSTTATWGATITGGGSNHVLAYYNGTSWTVAAK